nr:hypothetical protein [Deltaproteobacteria bacterium]NIS70884.1 hypothetical protein [Pseudomonadota bacterium]
MKTKIARALSLAILSTLIFLTGVISAHAAVVLEDVSVGTTEGGSTITIIDHQATGSDRLMLVGVSFNNDSYETITGITFNGVPLTLVGTEANSDDARVEIWSLVNPDLGNHDVEITFNAALYRQAIAGVVTFSGVDQTSPLGTFASAEADGNLASVDVPSATDELVFG